MDSHIFGVNGSKNRAIQIHSINQLADSNGQLLSVRHRDGEKTRIMTAKIMVINTDEEGRFIGLPDGNLAFELPENIGEIDQERAFELVKRYIQEKEMQKGKDVYYLGILHKNQNGYQVDKPNSNTVERAVEKRFKEIKREEKLAEEARKEQEEVAERKRQKEFQERLRVEAEREKAEREEKMANPFMALSEKYNEEDDKTYISGEMTDVRTGEILRLRKIESLEDGKYSGYIDRVPSEDAVDCFSVEQSWYKKINFKIAGMTLMEIAEEMDKNKIRTVSEHLSKLYDKIIEKEQHEQERGEER